MSPVFIAVPEVVTAVSRIVAPKKSPRNSRAQSTIEVEEETRWGRRTVSPPVIRSTPVLARGGCLHVRTNTRIVVHQLLEKSFLPALARALDQARNQPAHSGARLLRRTGFPARGTHGFAPEHVCDGLPAANDPIQALVGGDKRTHLGLPLGCCAAMIPLSGFPDIFPIDIGHEYNSL
ncbi:MAG: hypothetical protein LC136_08020 [Burkholderiales bacterium]|nr:hypothetical protein [Burkholderiales bacterium]